MASFYLLDHAGREEARLHVLGELVRGAEEVGEVLVQAVGKDFRDAPVLQSRQDLARATHRLARLGVLHATERVAYLLQAEAQAARDVVAQDQELGELQRRDDIA